jgi:hypothetical protein
MGQLIDKLERTRRGYTQPFGFSGGGSKREKNPPILLLGAVQPGSDSDAKRVTEAELDGAVVAARGAKKSDAPKSLKDQTWGLWVEEALKDDPEGADFQVFSSDATSLGALSGDKRTTVMQVNPDLDDSLLRTINDLPVSAFLVSLADASALTLRQMMRIARVRGVTSKWLLVHVTQLPNKDELTIFRDAGVNGIIVNVADHSTDALKACRETLLDLPKPDNKRKNGAIAMLPRVEGARQQPGRRTEPDPDDDDDEGSLTR